MQALQLTQVTPIHEAAFLRDHRRATSAVLQLDWSAPQFEHDVRWTFGGRARERTLLAHLGQGPKIRGLKAFFASFAGESAKDPRQRQPNQMTNDRNTIRRTVRAARIG
jgi:hypothetical protein